MGRKRRGRRMGKRRRKDRRRRMGKMGRRKRRSRKWVGRRRIRQKRRRRRRIRERRRRMGGKLENGRDEKDGYGEQEIWKAEELYENLVSTPIKIIH